MDSQRTRAFAGLGLFGLGVVSVIAGVVVLLAEGSANAGGTLLLVGFAATIGGLVVLPRPKSAKPIDPRKRKMRIAGGVFFLLAVLGVATRPDDPAPISTVFLLASMGLFLVAWIMNDQVGPDAVGRLPESDAGQR